MATRLATMFDRAAAANLMRQFGEAVIYYPDGGDTGREITALVNRDGVEIIGETGEVHARLIEVRVRNDSTTGISSTEIDTGADEIRLPLRVGESSQRRQITEVLSTENGLVRFLIQ